MVKQVFYVTVYYLLCNSTMLYAQNGEVVYANERLPKCFDTYINNNLINAMIQDDAGFIWLATTTGLIRYDGYDFKHCLLDADSIPHQVTNSAKALAKDENGNIWAGYESGGLARYDVQAEKFTFYSTEKIMPYYLSQIYCLLADGDNVWIGTANFGLAKLDVKTGGFEKWDIATHERFPFLSDYRLTIENYVLQVISRDKNNLWLATAEGLLSFNKNTHEITVMRPKGNKKMHVDVYNVLNILPDGNKLWMGGWQSGIQCYDTLTKKWNDYNMLEGKKFDIGNIIMAMAGKDADELWLGTMDRGLCTFNKKNGTFNFLKSDSIVEGMPQILAMRLFSDSQQNLYVGFPNQFYFLKKKNKLFSLYPLSSYTERNSGASGATCFYESNDKRYLLVGTAYSDGLLCYDQKVGSSRVVTINVNGKEKRIDFVDEIVKRDSESAFVFCTQGVLIFDFVSGTLKKTVKESALEKFQNEYSISDISYCDTGELWLSSMKHGLINYSIADNRVRYFTHSDTGKTSIATNKITNSLADKYGHVWYSGYNQALLACMNVKYGNSVFFNKHGRRDSLKNSIITYDFNAYKNYILASTKSGLYIFDVKTKVPVIKNIICRDSGFVTDLVIKSVMQNDSIVWLHTDRGLYIYNINSQAYNYVKTEDEIKTVLIGILQSNHHDVFLNVSQYFCRVKKNAFQNKVAPLAPVLTSFSINDSNVNYTQELRKNKEINIFSNYDYFTVSFASLDYNRQSEITYSYMLSGLQGHWIDVGDKRYASFSGLTGGSYTLKLRCTQDNGISYSQITEFPIFIETIYYKTLWFRGTIAAIIALLIIAIYRYRLSQHRAILELNNRAQVLEKEKSIVQYENLVQQLNPHFLFNSLTSLSSLISVEPKIARQFVDQMSKIYRYILKSSENETVPLINEINFANTYIKLQQTRFSDGFEVNINVDEEFNHRKIVPVTIQNLIENAIKHNIIDGERPLVIDVYVEDEYLVVKNNLQKKNIVETSNKHGLNQMQTLYKYLSDKPIIINETLKDFTIKIPLI